MVKSHFLVGGFNNLISTLAMTIPNDSVIFQIETIIAWLVRVVYIPYSYYHSISIVNGSLVGTLPG